MNLNNPQITNSILSGLPEAEFELLRPYLTHVELPLRESLHKPKALIKDCYFIGSGLASVVVKSKHESLEVGLIGFEGLSAVELILGGDKSRHETFIQVAGHGWRISTEHLLAALKKSPSLQRSLLVFAQQFLEQATNTAFANGTATVEQRLARWLLMADDRIKGNHVPLTHEFLALMLGVRRSGVTVALNLLEQRGHISGARGLIKIESREGLEEAADGTYIPTTL
jgi:CRP-like cAMP-binding protein